MTVAWRRLPCSTQDQPCDGFSKRSDALIVMCADQISRTHPKNMAMDGGRGPERLARRQGMSSLREFA